MLPTGHIAAGYLVSIAATKWIAPESSPDVIRTLGWWGAFWGFAPDLDEFWFFIKNRTWLVSGDTATVRPHRQYFSHAPLLWMLAGIVFILFLHNSRLWPMGYIIWLASWSHFALDSIEFGIMWLWPFSTKFYALKGVGKESWVIAEKNFFKHSLKFLRQYAKTVSFYLEVLIIITAVIIFIR